MAGASYRRTAPMRWSDFDPLRFVWRGLTSVRFALGLIGFLAFAALLGAVIPQLPIEMRGNPAAEAAWFNLQHDRFGILGEPMERLGLFQVFRTPWFIAALGLLAASVCVCTANRLPPIWRNVLHPQTRVPDEYLLNNEATITAPAEDAATIAHALRKRRYKVTLTQENGATYLFADRFSWAQFATFVSHLALILFLAGGFVTVLTAREQQVFIAEGERALPVFGIDDPDHMQLYVEDAVGRFDASGFPLEFRSDIVVYRNGAEVARGSSTVNDPLNYGGYNFHQSAYFSDGVSLVVRDARTGNVVYDEVLALTSTALTPRVIVRDSAGTVILDDAIVPTDFISEGNAAGTVIRLPSTDRSFWIGARPSDADNGWQLIVFETTTAGGARAVLSEGERADLQGATLSFVGMTNLPSAVVENLPGQQGPQGVAELSDGPSGQLLTVGPIAGQALALSPGEPVRIGDYEYEYGGKREFTGITARRDPGTTFIWLGTGLLLLGLMLTFYTPRRRLWGKIVAGQASFRGLGGRRLAVEKEIREVAASAGRS